MNTRKIQIPKIDKYLQEIKDQIEATKIWIAEADQSINYDEDEYLTKAKYIKLWDTILNKLDEWERNFFIYDYINEDSIDEKANIIQLNPNSYRVYQSNIRKHIRQKFL